MATSDPTVTAAPEAASPRTFDPRKADIGKEGQRERLMKFPDHEPYWKEIRPREHIGFRVSPTNAGACQWYVRYWGLKMVTDKATGERTQKNGNVTRSLCDGSKKYSEAYTLALAMLDRLKNHGVALDDSIVTVGDLCRAFVKHAAKEKGDKNANNHKRNFVGYVYGDTLEMQPLESLEDRHLAQWLVRMEQRDGMVATESINRLMVGVRAALNYGHAKKLIVTQPSVWGEVLKRRKAKPDETGRREVAFTREQRRALLAAVSEQARPFFEMLCVLPLRPGAVAQLTVGSYDRSQRVLTILRGTDKMAPTRKIQVPQNVHALLLAASKGKLPAAPLFSDAGGEAWCSHTWGKEMRKARMVDGFQAAFEENDDSFTESVTYSLRHSTITDMVKAGTDLVTVANIAGTSVKMIQDHYGHLQDQHEKALAVLAL